MSRDSYRIIGLSLIVGAAFWAVDTSVDAVFHYGAPEFWDKLFAPRELMFRGVSTLAFLLFGVAVAWMFAKQRKAEAKAREASVLAEMERAKSQSILECLGQGVSMTSLDYEVLYENPVQQQLLGAHVGEKCYEAYEGRTTPCTACPMRATFEHGSIETAYRTLDRNGHSRHFHVTTSPLLDPDGEIIAGMKIMRDVTQQTTTRSRLRQTILEKELLLQEVHHRVKNNLQLILSLLSLQSGQVASPEYASLLKESQDRIRSMALVHEQLSHASDLTSIHLDEYVRGLVHALLEAHGITNGRIHVEVCASRVAVPLDVATPCALILNELISNALTHAFPSDAAGIVEVIIARELEGKQLVLSVEDDGCGLPEDFDVTCARTLGLQIVRNLAEQQLDGELTIRSAETTQFRVSVPIAEIAVADEDAPESMTETGSAQLG